MSGAIALVVLSSCFVAFSIASFRHFSKGVASRGNVLIRVLTVAATLGNLLAALISWPVQPELAWISVVAGILSLALFQAAIRSTAAGELHVAFTGKGPDRLVTRGIYGWIRNPFYTSYLIYWAAWVPATNLYMPSLAVLGVFVVLYWIAVRDEERFLRMYFGDQYVAFQARTGRFLPRLRMLRS